MMYTRLPFLPRPLEIKYCFKRSIWLDILSLHFGHYGAFRIGRSKKYYSMQSVTAKKVDNIHHRLFTDDFEDAKIYRRVCSFLLGFIISRNKLGFLLISRLLLGAHLKALIYQS